MIDQLTTEELRAQLKANKIDYSKAKSKKDLIDILENAIESGKAELKPNLLPIEENKNESELEKSIDGLKESRIMQTVTRQKKEQLPIRENVPLNQCFQNYIKTTKGGKARALELALDQMIENKIKRLKGK